MEDKETQWSSYSFLLVPVMVFSIITQYFVPHSHSSPNLIINSSKRFTVNTKCTSNSSQPDFPTPSYETTTSAQEFPMERRRRSEILRRRSKTGLVKPKPPNHEIGWKRTKEIPILDKPKGYVIMDYLEKLAELMEREFGSTALLAKVGEVVAERAREEAEVLLDEGKVEDTRMITELFRVLKLMEMDLAMVKAAVKEETFTERLHQAKARCRQAILVANSL